MQLVVKIIPNASLNKICGFYNHMLKIQLQGLPEKGRLNQVLIEFLAESMNLPKAAFEIKTGLTSPVKRVEISDQYALKVDLFLAKYQGVEFFVE